MQLPTDKTVTCTSDLWNVTCVLDPAPWIPSGDLAAMFNPLQICASFAIKTYDNGKSSIYITKQSAMKRI